MIDRITLVARLQVQRRATVVAELSTDWIAVVAEGAHPVAKIPGARGVGPRGGGWRVHAGILSRRKEFALGLDGNVAALKSNSFIESPNRDRHRTGAGGSAASAINVSFTFLK
jgi:hypothetical protein